MKISGIYRIFCTESKKSYIGQSINIDNRIGVHFHFLRKQKHPNRHLQSAFDKYGESCFTSSILEVCDHENLTEREQYWMEVCGYENLYNLSPSAGTTLGFRHSQESIQKMSQSKKGKCPVNKGQPSKLRGRQLSEEHKAKISESHKGKVRPKFDNKWIDNLSKAHKGRKHTEESKQRMKIAQKKAWEKRKMYRGLASGESYETHSGDVAG